MISAGSYRSRRRREGRRQLRSYEGGRGRRRAHRTKLVGLRENETCELDSIPSYIAKDDVPTMLFRFDGNTKGGRRMMGVTGQKMVSFDSPSPSPSRSQRPPSLRPRRHQNFICRSLMVLLDDRNDSSLASEPKEAVCMLEMGGHPLPPSPPSRPLSSLFSLPLSPSSEPLS